MEKESVSNKFGKVELSESVIAAVAGLAATEVKGVKCLAGGIAHDAITRSDGKNLFRAVRVTLQDEKILLKVAVVLDGTVSVPEMAKALQEKVRSSVEMMTGIEVSSVDVLVTEVNA